MLCHKSQACKEQHEAAAFAVQALGVVFTAYGKDLERVEVFKYLGQLLSMDNSDLRAACSNMSKACKI